MAVRALLSTLRCPPPLLLLLSRMMSSPAPCGGVLPRHKHRLSCRAHHITVSLDRGEGWLLEAAPVHNATQNTTRSRRACTLGATRRHAHHAVSVPTSSTPGLLMSCHHGEVAGSNLHRRMSPFGYSLTLRGIRGTSSFLRFVVAAATTPRRALRRESDVTMSYANSQNVESMGSAMNPDDTRTDGKSLQSSIRSTCRLPRIECKCHNHKSAGNRTLQSAAAEFYLQS